MTQPRDAADLVESLEEMRRDNPDDFSGYLADAWTQILERLRAAEAVCASAELALDRGEHGAFQRLTDDVEAWRKARERG